MSDSTVKASAYSTACIRLVMLASEFLIGCMSKGEMKYFVSSSKSKLQRGSTYCCLSKPFRRKKRQPAPSKQLARSIMLLPMTICCIAIRQASVALVDRTRELTRHSGPRGTKTGLPTPITSNSLLFPLLLLLLLHHRQSYPHHLVEDDNKLAFRCFMKATSTIYIYKRVQAKIRYKRI